MLVTLEPTAFPTTISGEPSTTANIELTSSGNEVPMATMVRPTTYDGTPKKMPSSSAPSVNQSADFTRARSETTNSIIQRVIRHRFSHRSLPMRNNPLATQHLFLRGEGSASSLDALDEQEAIFAPQNFSGFGRSPRISTRPGSIMVVTASERDPEEVVDGQHSNPTPRASARRDSNCWSSISFSVCQSSGCANWSGRRRRTRFVPDVSIRTSSVTRALAVSPRWLDTSKLLQRLLGGIAYPPGRLRPLS